MDLGVVAGDHVLAAQLPGTAQQSTEFQIAVAVDAGTGGVAPLIAADEFIHDRLPEGILKIKGVVGHPHPAGHAFRVFHIVQGTAGALLILPQNIIAEQPHGGPNAVVARLLGQKCGHGAVYAAAHANQCFLHNIKISRCCT